LRAHPRSIAKLKAKLNLLTGRSNGMGYERCKQVLHQVLRGWVNYFKLADMKKSLETIGQ
jgi:RNA-directed DNA polymerase